METRAFFRSAVLAGFALSAAAAAEVAEPPCRAALAQGSIEERRAQYPQALALFDQARQEDACRLEAQLGLARTFNSMNDHKKALTAARWVLAHTAENELLAHAHYEVGRALHKPGKRVTQQKADAETAYLRTVELSGGEHLGAVRALLRLYRETRQDEKLAALEERFPDVRASTRAQRVRLLADRKQAAAPPSPRVPTAEERRANAGLGFDCATRRPSPVEDWQLELPTNCGGDEKKVRAVVSRPAPQVTGEDHQAGAGGAVEFEARVDTAGEVDRVRILKGLSPGLEIAALEAACQWRFEPAAESEEPSPSFFYCGTIEFGPD